MKKLANGIYRDQYSIRAVVHISAGRREKRFDAATPLATIKRWRHEQIAELERMFPNKRAGARAHGTFSAEAKKYLKTLSIASWKSRRSELRAWELRIGAKRRARISSDDIRAAIKAWGDAGVTAKTIKNRVAALRAMFHALDGAESWTPVKDVAVPRVERRLPDYVPTETLCAVERNLRQLEKAGRLKDSKLRARYMVLVTTGARPVHLKRTEPHHIDLERRVWNIRAAKGGEPIELWLNDEMLAAWRVFIGADAWGPWNDTHYARVLRKAGWPAKVRPYNAKHSLGKDLGENGVDFQTIADWYGHTNTKTTRIYVPVLNSQLRRASESLNGRLGWATESKPASPEPQPQAKMLADSVGSATDADRNAMILQMLEEIRSKLDLCS